ncbi:biotin synthase BioB [Hydrogenothermus marinus]|uniref:Biotin synthase n=1 Tax=Hydrogenothermus marinus TaxID=133270 RepID=A0A3M0B6Y5_9AQUI|nr:biotin synthase BioB [Hydrogenothermus marinus]RMA93123.1 biotin synthase [Hydrogenothermus marinus]
MDLIKNLAERVINGEKISKEEGLKILNIPDEQVMDLVEEASKIREYFFKNEVEFCSLINAKNGGCSEDCSFCAQSSKYPTPINAYGLVSKEEMLEGAEKAVSINANRYCIVVSGKRATKEEVEKIAEAVKDIKEKYPVKVCCSIGTVDKEDLKLLKEAGVNRINHNLETSEKYFSNIVSTHTWKDRFETIKAIQEVGLSTCCGGIFGMGESDEDIVDLADTYRNLNVHSIPLNFLIPIPGTPFENTNNLTPAKCLKIVALFRIFNPKAEIRLCGGREQNLKDYHDIAMEVANCLMAGGYLTRAGREPGKDEEMARRLGRKLLTGKEDFSLWKELGVQT